MGREDSIALRRHRPPLPRLARGWTLCALSRRTRTTHHAFPPVYDRVRGLRDYSASNTTSTTMLKPSSTAEVAVAPRPNTPCST